MTMSESAISIENISKQYFIGLSGPQYNLVREVIPAIFKGGLFSKRGRTGLSKEDKEFIWALKDVSFQIKRSEIVGIIGKNGAGKSTLLKILTRITEPTAGRAKIFGRVSSLLEVGTGFHEELTGRENIFLNGAILGMKKDEIKREFDNIVDFSGISRFLDMPVKHYSSGMYVRLAFSVAAHLQPDILLVDEVLSVGDAFFQKKCLGKMGDISGQGRTILFVSHNMQAVESLCSRGIVIDGGRVAYDGSSADAVSFYLKNLFMADFSQSLKERKDRKGNGSARLTAINFYNQDGIKSDSLKSGEKCCIEFEYEAGQELRNVSFAFTVRDSISQYLFRPSSEDTGQDFKSLPNRGRLRCIIPRLPLVSGQYRITPRLVCSGIVEDYVEGAAILTVEGGDFFGSGKMNSHSPVILDHSWEAI